jgi:hypothetical protein
MARKRAKSNKKTLQEVKKRIQKQAGGMGPLGSRGRELPPQDFEDKGVPRPLPPMPTPKPSVNLPPDMPTQVTPPLPPQGQVQPPVDPSGKVQSSVPDSAPQTRQDNFDERRGPEVGDERIINGFIHVWTGFRFENTGVRADDGTGTGTGTGEGDEGDEGGEGTGEGDEDGESGGTPTPAPTPAAFDPRQTASDIVEGRFQGPQIPDPVKIDIGEDVQALTIDQDRSVTDIAKITPPSQEQVTLINDVIKADSPLDVKAAEIKNIYQVPEDVAIRVARGEIRPENLAEEVEVQRVDQIQAAEVEVEPGAVAQRVVGVLSPEAKATAAQNAGTTLSRVTRAKKQLSNAGLSEVDIQELGNDPEMLEARLADFSEAQRGIIAGLPEEALVSNQLDSLLSGIEEGEIPAWARPAVASVESMLAKRGLSASTVGRDALLNTIIQSAIPLAQSNAQAIQQSVAQQKTIEAQVAEANAQRNQQVALTNAQNVFNLNMAQFNADQQTELSNSKFFQTISITEANNRQQGTIQDAVLMSQANLAEADFAQRTQINNAKNFLTMDMANLSNEQQAFMIEAQQEQQRMLSNQSAENARRQFNATSQQQVEQFNASLANQVSQFNAQQQNASQQFNAQQKNAAEARRVANEFAAAKANAAMINNINQFNAQMSFEKDKFNTANKQAIMQSNVEWRRKANLADTAIQNQINMQNAQNAFELNNAALSFMWQELRDQADFDFRRSEGEANRKISLLQTAIANTAEGANNWESNKTIADLVSRIFGGSD